MGVLRDADGVLPSVDRQTPVKTVPSHSFGMQAVKTRNSLIGTDIKNVMTLNGDMCLLI